MARPVFLSRPDIEDDDPAISTTAQQLIARDRLQSTALLQKGTLDLADLGKAGLGKLAREVQILEHTLIGYPVLDEEAFLLRLDQASPVQHLRCCEVFATLKESQSSEDLDRARTFAVFKKLLDKANPSAKIPGADR